MILILKRKESERRTRTGIPAPLKEMEDRELLQYALEHGMIDMSYVRLESDT